MQQITLSDHTAEKSQQAAAQRRADHESALQTYEELVQTQQDKVARLRAARQEAFRAGRLLLWLGRVLQSLLVMFNHTPRRPVMAGESRDEVVWKAGGEGEQRVADTLCRWFPRDWALVAGYRNAGGEIDQLLVGPQGIMAIEIKFVNGKVYCEGDRWWRDKYDRYGNLVESDVPIADRKGRGPSAQVNTAADRLEAFLRERAGLSLKVSRAVILAHESSEIGRLSRQTVSLVSTLDQLNQGLITRALPGDLGGATVEQVVEQLRRDHAFHNRPRDKQRGERGDWGSKPAQAGPRSSGAGLSGPRSVGSGAAGQRPVATRERAGSARRERSAVE